MSGENKIEGEEKEKEEAKNITAAADMPEIREDLVSARHRIAEREQFSEEGEISALYSRKSTSWVDSSRNNALESTLRRLLPEIS